MEPRFGCAPPVSIWSDLTILTYCSVDHGPDRVFGSKAAAALAKKYRVCLREASASAAFWWSIFCLRRGSPPIARGSALILSSRKTEASTVLLLIAVSVFARRDAMAGNLRYAGRNQLMPRANTGSTAGARVGSLAGVWRVQSFFRRLAVSQSRIELVDQRFGGVRDHGASRKIASAPALYSASSCCGGTTPPMMMMMSSRPCSSARPLGLPAPPKIALLPAMNAPMCASTRPACRAGLLGVRGRPSECRRRTRHRRRPRRSPSDRDHGHPRRSWRRYAGQRPSASSKASMALALFDPVGHGGHLPLVDAGDGYSFSARCRRTPFPSHRKFRRQMALARASGRSPTQKSSRCLRGAAGQRRQRVRDVLLVRCFSRDSLSICRRRTVRFSTSAPRSHFVDQPRIVDADHRLLASLILALRLGRGSNDPQFERRPRWLWPSRRIFHFLDMTSRLSPQGSRFRRST